MSLTKAACAESGHPRTCGAAHANVDVIEDNGGSSPYLRGSRGRQHSFHGHQRVIPVPAGQPFFPFPSFGEAAGHPRTCGAAGIRRRGRGSAQGSSPYLRGSRPPAVRAWRPAGVIPVPAGQPTIRKFWKYRSKGHPRTCGAALVQRQARHKHRGSSPYLRGSLLPDQGIVQAVRVIPVPAGQPMTLNPSRTWIRGHPRTCGAAVLGMDGSIQMTGSSPYLRGSPRLWWWMVSRQRVIPVPAGQPCPQPLLLSGHTGHPRTCGAATRAWRWRTPTAGSSPYLRGSHRPGHRRRGRVRVIPVPAGQPVGCGRCGIAGHGSSPYLRGSPELPAVAAPLHGVIPVPAGQPRRPFPPGEWRPGHPRTCGAAGTMSRLLYFCEGSSPYLRGSLPEVFHAVHVARVIPVPAGQPPVDPSAAVPPTGHPRTCGAAVQPVPDLASDPGSSPYLRGSQGASAGRGTGCGVIPVPAGQPSRWRQCAPSVRGHPRTCGAACSCSISFRLSSGSSPYLRGSLGVAVHACAGPRVIPVPAGQPGGVRVCGFLLGGHPRTCGAALHCYPRAVTVAGSSPYLRGSRRAYP